jgi:anti-sigma regulatory factor (Ser/Thr protein kinase)
MAEITTLQINAQLSDLDRIRDFVREKARALAVDSGDIYDLLLVVTEMVTNIIHHGYRDQPGPIEIEIRPQGDAVIIILRDQAPAFDPTQVPTPNLNVPLEKRPRGGMGVHLTREFTDQMTYRYSPEGGNQLTLVKKGVIPNPLQEK